LRELTDRCGEIDNTPRLGRFDGCVRKVELRLVALRTELREISRRAVVLLFQRPRLPLRQLDRRLGGGMLLPQL
jgi:hypothetical protein